MTEGRGQEGGATPREIVAQKRPHGAQGVRDDAAIAKSGRFRPRHLQRRAGARIGLAEKSDARRGAAPACAPERFWTAPIALSSTRPFSTGRAPACACASPAMSRCPTFSISMTMKAKSIFVAQNRLAQSGARRRPARTRASQRRCGSSWPCAENITACATDEISPRTPFVGVPRRRSRRGVSSGSGNSRDSVSNRSGRSLAADAASCAAC